MSGRNGHEAAYTKLYAAGEIEDLCAATVTPTEVEWLWRGRIPFGKLTMFDGDPDLGKSVVTVDITARVSTGRVFPDGAACEAGNVLMANVEDGAGDTIVPRLEAHGADRNRVYLFSNVPDGKGGKRLLDLPGDVVILENLVRKREAKLLIIDPVLTVLSGDANKDQDARKALAPLAEMADRTGVAVVAVRHLNKSVGLKAIQRGGGNMGLIGVARAGSFFAKDPDDDRRRIMAPHKSNLAEKPPSLVYRIVTSEVHNTARVEWMGASEYDADGLAADATTPHEKSQLDEAKEFLREELGKGRVWAKQVHKDARDAGIAEATLRRAKDALRVRSKKIGTECWSWSLPVKERGHNEDAQEHVPDDPDDPDEHLEHLEHLPINKGNEASNKANRSEHAQHAQPRSGGLTEDLRLLSRQALREGNGPKKALEHFQHGHQDILSVTRSVMHYWKRGQEDPDRWRESVFAAAAELEAERPDKGPSS